VESIAWGLLGDSLGIFQGGGEATAQGFVAAGCKALAASSCIKRLCQRVNEAVWVDGLRPGAPGRMEER
jgi:hypothetical protein